MHVKSQEGVDRYGALTKRAPRQLHFDRISSSGGNSRGNNSGDRVMLEFFYCHGTAVPDEMVSVIVAAVAGWFIVVGVYVDLDAVIVPI
jgi:hypothetical protein